MNKTWIFYIYLYISGYSIFNDVGFMISLYVIDDHFLIGSGFKEEFDPETDGIEVSGCSTNVHDAIEEIQPSKINIIVLDLFIKFIDPVKNIRRLRSRFPKIPIVILSFEYSIEYQVKMFNEGAKAFLSKNDDKETMKDVFHQVSLGKVIIPDEVLKSKESTFHIVPKPVLLPGEREIMMDLSNGNSIKAIATTRQITSSAIDKVLKRIREKFNTRTNYELLVFLAKDKKI